MSTMYHVRNGPVTGEWNDSLLGDFIWSNANVGEAVADVMTPLSWSILEHSFKSVSAIPGYNMVGNICGRFYSNTSIVLKILRITGRNIRDFSNELGGGYDQLQEWIEQSDFSLPPTAIIHVAKNLIRIVIKQAQAVKNAGHFIWQNPQWCADMRSRLNTIRSSAELADFWEHGIAAYGGDAFMTVFSTAMQYTDLVGKLRRDLGQLVDADDAGTLLSNVSNGDELLASLGPTVGVWKVHRGEMTRAEFLEKYGHRGSYEKSVFEPSFMDRSVWLDQLLEEFARKPVDVEAMLAKQREEFNNAWNRFQVHYPNKAKPMRMRLKKAAKYARLRESARDEFMRITLVSHPCVLRAAEYTGVGDDVYFLTFQELWNELRGTWSNARDHVSARKAAFERQKSLPVYPPIIRGQFDAVKWATDPNRHSDYFDSHESASPKMGAKNSIIKGMAGSAGRVEGLVRRVDRVEEAHQLQQGEILVTAQTNIGWTPYFPRLAAVVTDVGAPLSHAAIVARELGIPAVVGCRDATVRLKTGDRVRVDGGAGTVELK